MPVLKLVMAVFVICCTHHTHGFNSDMDTASLYGTENEKGQYTVVHAVAGSTVHLPCRIRSPQQSTGAGVRDTLVRPRLVLWYLGNAGTPVYVYDNRQGSAGIGGSHWIDSLAVDRARVSFHPSRLPATLRISNVQSSDQGVYRCRVDFDDLPARNSRVNMTVIVPAGVPEVQAPSGEFVGNSTTFAFAQGDSATLICRSRGGRPMGRVLWSVQGHVVSDLWQQLPETRVTENRLSVGPMGRQHAGQQLTCTVANHAAVPARSLTITINVTLPPLTTRIIGWNEQLQAGRSCQLSCQTTGSWPPADISWWLAGRRLNFSEQSVIAGGNVTVSKLVLVPRPGDNGAPLRCRATNNRLGGVLEDVWKLRVIYAPVVRIELLSALGAGRVLTNHSLQMICRVQARPAVHHINWTFNGRVLNNATSSNSIVLNDTVTMYHAQPPSAGTYKCSATNAVGTSKSDGHVLRVVHAPECAVKDTATMWAMLGETVEVLCKVISEPHPTRFHWSLNTISGQVLDLPEANCRRNRSMSSCEFTPHDRRDFGELRCRAENSVGVQQHACHVKIARAERPRGLGNCTVQTPAHGSRLVVNCQHSGSSRHDQTTEEHVESLTDSLTETFVMEVRDMVEGRLLDNVTSSQQSSSDTVSFRTSALEQSRHVSLTMYSFNMKGVSDQYITHAKLASDVAQQVTSTGSDNLASSMYTILPALITLLVMLMCVLALTVYAVSCSRRKSHGVQRPLESTPDPTYDCCESQLQAEVEADERKLQMARGPDILSSRNTSATEALHDCVLHCGSAVDRTLSINASRDRTASDHRTSHKAQDGSLSLQRPVKQAATSAQASMLLQTRSSTLCRPSTQRPGQHVSTLSVRRLAARRTSSNSMTSRVVETDEVLGSSGRLAVGVAATGPRLSTPPPPPPPLSSAPSSSLAAAFGSSATRARRL